MAKKANYRVQLRRRREGKTDYQARKALVTSRKPRLVTRGSNKNVEVQIIIAKPHGDEVLASANSHELIKSYGWRAPTGNIPAAYLTGLLAGLKAKAAGIKEAILDLGLVSPTKGSRSFAVLSGVVDAGVAVPHSEEKIVKERVKGDHIAKYAKSLGAGSEEYIAKFSQYNAQGVAPEKIGEHFAKVKADIIAGSKSAKLPPEAIKLKAAPKEKAPKAVEAAPAPKEAAPKEKAPVKAKEEKIAEVAPVKEKVAAKTTKEKAPKEKAPKAVEAAPAPKEAAPKEKAPVKAKEEKIAEVAPVKEKVAAKTTKEKAPKEKASKAKAIVTKKKAPKEKAVAKPKAAVKEKAAKEEAAPKEPAPKEKEPKPKAAKKGGKKE
jgi:large subunit ribosomal protein L18